ncbi:MAG: hypothetical protein HF978_09955 [Desulfobacteraceae bacterium]|nr:hypothetical protein [Desulfobacteraceae bacterium]MBC2755859.1 hypothetical protein [Desulfobacteraceae bacterium]
MKNFKLLPALASIVITGSLFIAYYYVFECPGSAADLAAIEQVFDDFKQAAIQQNGNTAINLTDQATYDRMEKLQHLVLEATKDELDAEPIAHQFYVMMLRLELPPRILATMSPRDVAVYLLENRIIGNFFEERSRIDQIEVQGRRASGRHMKLKWQVGDPLAFVQESGRWRFRLVAMIDEVNGQMKNLVAQHGGDEQEMMYRIVEFITMKRLKKNHFLPVKGEL